MLKCINRNKASSSPKRLELLGLLCHAAKTVETLSQEANISVKLASSHLQELKVSKPGRESATG